MSTPDPAEGLTAEIARLANELFQQRPDAGLPAPGGGSTPPFAAPGVLAWPALPSPPSALNPNAGGLSVAQADHPPSPPVFPPPSIAIAPPPKESDLRAIPTGAGAFLGLPALALVRGPEGDPSAPYFLTGAGFGPTPAPSAAPAAVPPGASFGVPGVPEAAGLGTTVPASSAGAETLVSKPAPDAASAPVVPTSSLGFLDAFEVRPEVVPAPRTTRPLFDAASIKKDFPILSERVNGRPLVWLDNAATTQKPRAVIERLSYFYEHENSNIHRAAHTLAARATEAYEGARERTRKFLGAPSAEEIVFVRGTTEAINLVAQSWGRRNVRAGDEIVISWLEHHANIVPWQMLCAETGARLCVAPVDGAGQIILEDFEKLLGPKTRLVSVTQVSNALGTITPAKEIVQMAHRHGARVLVDGAQAVSHMPVDVQALDCDFYCFSGHKVFGPTGIGALFGKSEVLAHMPPWQGGGNMIKDVTFERTQYNPAPWKFEAGTGNIADAVGLGAAIDYVSNLGLANVSRYEHELLVYATERLERIPGLRMIGKAAEKAGVLSFVLDGVRTEDVSAILDEEGIAVRSGHHCAQPILRRFGVEATVRASLAPYNTIEDIDALCAAVARLR